ncbi:MAG: DNA starvation/stationary phase protection protein [bacterium]|nr:DNA starvation/stationary phase protection protein [bacterium]
MATKTKKTAAAQDTAMQDGAGKISIPAANGNAKGSAAPNRATAPDEPKPDIGLNDEQRGGSIELLNRHLANGYVLYTKTRNYHWNVRSRRFAELHEFFEEQYDQLAEAVDQYAERARQLGGMAAGTLAEFLQLATLKEEPGVYPDPQTMIRNLLTDHEAVIRSLRADVDRTSDELHDTGTSDFLTAMMENHEKMAWMLRAHLVEHD